MTRREGGRRKADPPRGLPAANHRAAQARRPRAGGSAFAFTDGCSGGVAELVARAVALASSPGDVVGETTTRIVVDVELLHDDGTRTVRHVTWHPEDNHG